MRRDKSRLYDWFKNGHGPMERGLRHAMPLHEKIMVFYDDETVYFYVQLSKPHIILIVHRLKDL